MSIVQLLIVLFIIAMWSIAIYVYKDKLKEVASRIRSRMKPKCFVCKKQTGELEDVSWENAYCGCWWVYHESCVEEVLKNPEHYAVVRYRNGNVLDWTLRLDEHLSTLRQEEVREAENLKRRLSAAQKRRAVA